MFQLSMCRGTPVKVTCASFLHKWLSQETSEVS